MLIREFGHLPVYGPETGTGADTGTETGGGAPPTGTGGVEEGAGAESGAAEETEQQEQGQQERRQEGRGSGRTKVRQQLESAAEEARKKSTQQGARDQQGRFQAQQGQQQEGQQQDQGQQQQSAAPEAWAKEAKAAWGQLPQQVQAAVLKRETDMAAGVENLKKGYKDLDDAIKPYSDAISQYKTTPAAAVKQLFDWMMALTNEASELQQGRAPSRNAFAALAKSYGLDPVRLLAHLVQNPGQQQQQPQQQVQQGQPQLDPNVKAYIDRMFGGFSQGLTQLNTTVQQQSQAKTNEMLAIWAKDKPYFNDVRVVMAQLMTPGANGSAPVVPAREDGNADLDKAYELACSINPAVQAKMTEARTAAEAKAKADKEAAEKLAQKQKLEAARKASGSIPISAPGVPGDGKQQGPKRGKSVKESIADAIKEVRGGA